MSASKLPNQDVLFIPLGDWSGRHLVDHPNSLQHNLIRIVCMKFELVTELTHKSSFSCVNCEIHYS